MKKTEKKGKLEGKSSSNQCPNQPVDLDAFEVAFKIFQKTTAYDIDDIIKVDLKGTLFIIEHRKEIHDSIVATLKPDNLVIDVLRKMICDYV